MHIPSLLVLLHGPKEPRLAPALFFPSLANVLLLLLVLDKMLAFVLDDQCAPVVKLGEEIGVKRARGGWQPEHPHHVAHPTFHLRVLLDCPRTLLFLPVVKLPDEMLAVVVFGELERAMIEGRGPVIVRVKSKGVLVARLHGCARTKEPKLVAGIVCLLPVS